MSEPTGAERMLAPATERLGRMHHAQVHRDPWPDFGAFEVDRYDAALRRAAAVQWGGRARAEHGSVQQFSILTHVLCNARVELHVLGALARLQTDEVRHAELCAAMALACWPEGTELEPAVFRWERPRLPWVGPPAPGDDPQPMLAWAAEAILVSCCIGETLSRPMLEAIAVVATDPVAEAVARQILRDEHLHASFGWETLGLLLPRMSNAQRASLEQRMTRSFGAVESTTACGIPVEAVAGKSLEIGPSDDLDGERHDQHNLGTLTDEQYAMIFFATMETEVLPRLEALGLPAMESWRRRPRPVPGE
ncbi:hypothetical protein [Paraliomyxa miuraensis]|uniref:hypothetical protein n=1 Tax=Paraliomyxa miuraensis TaxID=376150 RepID=UPI002250F51E|nr:hypothetical protein [Paraliomyxa miuraensis]MCX4246722.1 hypothetical protein [Paraliomyxa miuraensis]